MRIAVTDACIFIDILDLKIASLFFGLDLDIHTSFDVFNELYDEQKELLKAYELGGKLKIHNITSEERLEIMASNFPKSLSDNDKTVIFLAKKINGMVLSSDKAVRNHAKDQAIEYHGMLWVFDKLMELELLKPADAIDKIKLLVSMNIIYQNNADLMTEINNRIEIWSKK
jgi:hypothetical protein